MGLVGKKAPKFSATAVVNGGEFQDDFVSSVKNAL